VNSVVRTQINVSQLNKLFYQPTLLACAEGKIIHSSMTVVGLDYEHLKNICSADIEIVCRNSENSSVVSGSTESVQKFMKNLQVELNSSRIS